MLQNTPRKAFTLIELLVVVSVIVILIAIMIPALSKAIYHATIAKCGSNLHGIGNAVITYAHNNKDRYPIRGAVNATLGKEQGSPAWFVYFGTMGLLQYAPQGAVRFDDRPLFQKFLSVNKNLQDPFVTQIDLDDPNSMQANDVVSSSYDLFFGWRYNGEGKMDKLGNKVTWKNPRLANGPLHKWNILAMDRDLTIPAYVQDPVLGAAVKGGAVGPETSTASHPDLDDQMAMVVHNPQTDMQNGVDVWNSQWATLSGRKGKIDRNFLRDDASVELISGIMGNTNTTTFTNPDERMVVGAADSYGDPFFGTTLLPKH